MPDHTVFQAILVCPLDHARLTPDPAGGWRCTACEQHYPVIEAGGRQVADLRAVNVTQTRSVMLTVPHEPLDRYALVREMFRAPQIDAPHYSRKEVRQRFGTRIDKGLQVYCQRALEQFGPQARVLDLGCGNGGNRLYLEEIGFRQVITVDWIARGADVLADAHRLPFEDGAFQVVLSTAVFEHLYNPFLAMAEIARVLGPAGEFLGGASFWEAWHGSSYFHLTPDGWNALFTQNKMRLDDLWAGWGIIPAALTHVIVPGHFRGLGYGLQRILELAYRMIGGEASVRRFQLRASGSYLVRGVKD